MKPLYIILLAVLFAACKKEKTEPSKPVAYSEPDFALIPTKDATWYVHIKYNPEWDTYYPGNQYDLSQDTDLVKLDIIIKTTGRDTVIENNVCHIYSVVKKYYNAEDSLYFTESYHEYYMEDVKAQKVRFYNGQVAIDFSDSANRGQVVPFFSWRVMDLSQPDSLIVDRYYFKRWTMRNAYDSKYAYFYKAIGIGNTTGILPDAYAYYYQGQPVALDFVYKGDSIHFDYPLQ